MIWPCKNSPPPPYRPSPTPAAGPSWRNSATAAARSSNSPASCASASRRSRATCGCSGKPGWPTANRGSAPSVSASQRRRRRRPRLHIAGARGRHHRAPAGRRQHKPATARSSARMPRRRRSRRSASAPPTPNRPFCATQPQAARHGLLGPDLAIGFVLASRGLSRSVVMPRCHQSARSRRYDRRSWFGVGAVLMMQIRSFWAGEEGLG